MLTGTNVKKRIHNGLGRDSFWSRDSKIVQIDVYLIRFLHERKKERKKKQIRQKRDEKREREVEKKERKKQDFLFSLIFVLIKIKKVRIRSLPSCSVLSSPQSTSPSFPPFLLPLCSRKKNSPLGRDMTSTLNRYAGRSKLRCEENLVNNEWYKVGSLMP